MKAVVWGWAVIVTLAFCCAVHGAPDISGVYDTDFKELTLHQDGTRVTGTYKHRNGQIEGTLDGYVLTGRWVQSNGRGRLVFEFNPDLSGFKGKWGNRDATPKARWDGRSKQKKIGDAEKNTGNLGQSVGKTNSERGSVLIAEKHGVSEIKAESSYSGSRKLDSDTAKKTRKAGSKEISRETPASDKTEVFRARGKAGVGASSSSMTEPNEPMGQIPEQYLKI